MKKLSITCPSCKKLHSQDPVKKWKYGYVECSRFSCENCNKFFNHYISSKGKVWTIPKTTKNET